MSKSKYIVPVGQGYSTLEASPVGQALEQLLAKLKTLIEANKTSQDQSAENKSATERLEQLYELLEIAKDIGKYYTEGGKPSGFSLITLGTKLNSLRNLYKSLKQACNLGRSSFDEFIVAVFTINHPSLYEFTLEVCNVLEQLPDEFSQLVTFFDPKAVSLDLGPLGAMEYQQTEGTNGYQYRVKKGDVSGHFDLKELCVKYWGELKTALPEVLTVYLSKYAATPHVKSELAKANLIQAFISQEKTLNDYSVYIIQGADSYLEQEIESKSTAEAEVKWLDMIIRMLEQGVKEITNLQQRKQNYEQQNVAQLLKPYPDLEGQLKSDREAKLDTFYATKPLPNTIAATNRRNQFMLVDVKEALIFEPSFYQNLEPKKQAIETKKAELVKRQQVQVEIWCGQEIDRHQQQNSKFVKQLTELVQVNQQLTASAGDNISQLEPDARIAHITQQLQIVAQTQKQADQKLLDFQNGLQKTIEQPAQSQCPELLLKLEPSMAKRVSECYSQSREEANRCAQQLQGISADLQRQAQTLQAQLDKAKAAQELANAMKSSDPAAMVALKQNKEKELTLILAGKEQLYLKRKAIESQHQDAKALCSPQCSSNLETLVQEFGKLKQRICQQRDTLLLAMEILAKEGENVNQMFTDANLETSIDIRNAAKWLRDVLVAKNQQITQSTITANDEESKKLYTALTRAQELIKANSGRFPFKKLAKELQPILEKEEESSSSSAQEKGSKAKNILKGLQAVFLEEEGFDILLEKLQDTYHTKSRWEKHCKNPTNSMLATDTKALLTLIENRITSYTSCLVIAKAAADLENFRKLMGNLESAKLSVEQVESQLTRFAAEERNLSNVIQSMDEKIAFVENENVNWSKSVGILDQIVLLLSGNQDLSKNINELKIWGSELVTVDLLNKNQTEFFGKVETVNQLIKRLEESLDTLTQVIEKDKNLEDGATYQQNLSQINNLLDAAKESVGQFIAAACRTKLKDLNLSVSSSEQQLTGISGELGSSASISSLTSLNDLVTRYIDLSAKVDAASPKIEFLKTDQQKLTDSTLQTEIGTAITKLTDLSNKKGTVQTELLGKINSLLATISSELQQKQETLNVKWDESKSIQRQYATVLLNVAEHLPSFPGKELTTLKDSLANFPASKEVLDKLTTSLDAGVKLSQQVGVKQTANSNLAKRIEAREGIVQQYVKELTTYLTNRCRRYRYGVKDRLFPEDITNRSEIISTLIDALYKYEETGDPTAVFAYRAIKDSLGGFNLQSILNRLLVEVGELDYAVPDDYESQPKQVNPAHNLHEEARKILEDLNQSNPGYVEWINKLYGEIEKLQEFSNSIEQEYAEHKIGAEELKASLQLKLDRFIIDNQATFAGENRDEQRKLFLEFHDDFVCHIHSKDNVMSKHTSWLPYLLNIVLASLAVLTFGLAIPGKQLLTEYFTGKATFFCRAEGLSRVDAIERVASEEIASIAVSA